MNSAVLSNRLRYELKDLRENNKFHVTIDDNNSKIWYVSFKGAKDTLYENEDFKLKFEFEDNYVIYII